MGESNQKQERRFSQKQYDMLLRCSEEEKTKKEKDERGLWCNKWQYKLLKVCATNDEGIEKWNEWREEHPNEDIWLQGRDFSGWWLNKANFMHGTCYYLETQKEKSFGEVHLERGVFEDANLGKVDFFRAHLEEARFWHANAIEAQFVEAHLENANLEYAHLENAYLSGAHLEGSKLAGAHLENADLQDTHLENAHLGGALLENANLEDAHLENAYLGGAHLESADFSRAIVDGGTLIWKCKVDRRTKFEGVGLNSARIYPETKQLLEYNIRRMNWEWWYERHPKLRWLVKPFWLMSDYGLSTGRIILTFFGLAFIFATIYYHWARIAPPGIIRYLLVDREGVAVQWWLVPLRTLYFSIVTQTTLGFGDMYAKGQSIFGHLLLMLQVLLGYVLLGALITRFAVLFTAGGPAGKFAEEKKKTAK